MLRARGNGRARDLRLAGRYPAFFGNPAPLPAADPRRFMLRRDPFWGALKRFGGWCADQDLRKSFL